MKDGGGPTSTIALQDVGLCQLGVHCFGYQPLQGLLENGGFRDSNRYNILVGIRLEGVRRLGPCPEELQSP